MSNTNPPTVATPNVANEEMARDHAWILQNYYDGLIAQGLSANRIKDTTWFIERWFERYSFTTASGKCPLHVWEAMKPIAGPLRMKAFLKDLSSPCEDRLPCLMPSTVRGYAGILDRFFSSVMDFPYLGDLQTITSKYGPIETPFKGVEYPIHTRDHLRSERFFLTEKQILELLVFLREVYPKLTHRPLTAARLYTIILLITESGMRSVEVVNLDSVGETRDIFYDRKLIQTRFGKGHNTSGPLTRLIDLTRPAEITLKEYERNVRPHFRNYAENAALFLDSNGNRIKYSALHSTFTNFMKSARKHGVNLPEKLTIHDLRASFATNYLEAHPEKFWKLMELLGHVSPASTCLYIRCRGKSRVLTMREARGPRIPGTGMSATVYNR
jgi:integrase